MSIKLGLKSCSRVYPGNGLVLFAVVPDISLCCELLAVSCMSVDSRELPGALEAYGRYQK